MKVWSQQWLTGFGDISETKNNCLIACSFDGYGYTENLSLPRAKKSSVDHDLN